jgi:glycosyltransferase involved in cell wall biosynthesis
MGTLRAYARLKPENRPRLLVVGRGRDYEQKCRQYVKNHGLERDVEFLGSINTTDQLHAIYQGAVAMLYPSFYEGFGLPVVEALLSGCPVLTSTVSSLPEAAGPGALLCNPTNTDEMAFQLQQLVDDAALRERLARDGAAYCREHFDPDTLTRQMYELYQSLL